jgi:lipoate-protein ligase B
VTHPIVVERWPITPYEPALRWQQATADAVRNGAPEALALLQHPPTYTHGRQVRPEHLLVDEPAIRARGAEVIRTDRGGDVTFHGPGQLVAYPILDLRRHNLSPIDYVRALEATLIRTLARFDIEATRISGRPGVWVASAKIAAIGIRVQRGITTHGFALNVDPDLTWFEAIVPCGLTNTTVTSMEALGHPTTLAAVGDALIAEFTSNFDLALADEVRQRS